jgi:hypothetical protein
MIRHSHWARELDTARKKDCWHTVERCYTEKTARQIASDIRHNRRINGIKEGESWDAFVTWNDDRDPIFWQIVVKVVA